MKNNSLSLGRVLITLILVFIMQDHLFSQQNDFIKSGGMYIGLGFGLGQSQIKNSGTMAISEMGSEKMNSFENFAEIGYFFSTYIGISSGIGFNSYKSKATLKSFQNNFLTTDSEKETFEMRVSSSGFAEEQKIGYLSIPLCLNVRMPIKKSIGVFLKSGLSFAFPVNKTYSSSGIFSYKGYYQNYNVLLENLPAYGFENNKNTSFSGQLPLKSMAVFAIGSAGLDFKVKDNFQLVIAASYYKSLSSISGNTAVDQFQLSPAVGQINSMMGGSSKASAQSMRVSVSLRYFLKL